MMVVKEPQEMSDSVKNYPINPTWTADGMKPLQVAIVVTLVFTGVAGIASNPIFTLANQSVHDTPFLSASIQNQALKVELLKQLADQEPVSQLPALEPTIQE
jgi:NAD(P)H-quinone oxidoreductase subunit 2